MKVKFEFAKIFEIGNYQVLITKQEDDEKYKLVQSTQLSNCMPDLALGFETESKRDEVFDDYNLENAQKFLDKMISIVGE